MKLWPFRKSVKPAPPVAQGRNSAHAAPDGSLARLDLAPDLAWAKPYVHLLQAPNAADRTAIARGVLASGADLMATIAITAQLQLLTNLNAAGLLVPLDPEKLA